MGIVARFARWWSSRRRRVIGTCFGCEEPIHEGDEIADFMGGVIHDAKPACLDYARTDARLMFGTCDRPCRLIGGGARMRR